MFKLEDCVVYIASNKTKIITNSFNEQLLKHGSTRVQWIALYFIYNHEGIHLSSLSEKMNIKKSTVVRLIDRMEQAQLILRKPDKEDRRITHIMCTKHGKESYTKLFPIGEEFYKTIRKGITANELDIFLKVLSTMVSNS